MVDFFILSVLIAVSFSMCHGFVPIRMMKGTNESQADTLVHKLAKTEQPPTNLNRNQVEPRSVNQVEPRSGNQVQSQYLQPSPALYEQKLNEPRNPIQYQYQDRAQNQDHNRNVNQQENMQNLKQNDQDKNQNDKDRDQKNQDQIQNFFNDRADNYNQNNQAQIQNIQDPSENKQDQIQDIPAQYLDNAAQKRDNPAQMRENPAQNRDHPALNREQPVLNQDHPAQNEDKPTQNPDSSVQSREGPPQNRDSPAQNRDNLAQSRDSPAQIRDSLAYNWDSPAQNRDSPAQNQDGPVQNRSNPAQNRDSPAQNRNNQDKNQNQLQEPAQIQDQKENEQQNPAPSYRKSLSKFKRFEIRKRADDPDDHRKLESRLPQVSVLDADSISNLVQTIGKVLTVTNPEPKRTRLETRPSKNGMDAVDRIEKMFRDFSSSNIPTSMIYRAQQDYDVKPSFIRFKSSEQPSLKLELTSNSIVRFLETILSSPTARRYADAAGQQAAVAFRSLSEKFPELRRLEPKEPRYEDHPLYKH